MFKPTVEIRSKSGVLHFQRWKIIELPWFGIYLHKIWRSDEDLHPHSHPWNYLSLALTEGYEETDEHGKKKTIKPFMFSYKKRGQFHKLKLKKPAWTLFFVGRKYWTNRSKGISDWGYLVDGRLIHHEEYRALKRAGVLQ